MIMKCIKLFLISLLFVYSISNATSVFTEVQKEQFIKTYSNKYDIPEDYIADALDQAQFQPSSYLFVQPLGNIYTGKATKRGWDHYRKQFINPVMVSKGQQFLCAHREAFNNAQKEYGIPPEVIVGIIGVETSFGRNTGRYRVLDTLSTLAFNSPRRVDFYQDELAKYILICYKNKIDPKDMIGSIDGGFGIAQFMPSAYLDYAVSYTDDAPNLMTADDSIISIANYIKGHGWKNGQPVYYTVKASSKTCKNLNCNNRATTYPISVWKQNGVSFKGYVDPSQMADLITLSNTSQAILALNNFFSIFAYNHSYRYAFTTYLLGKAVTNQVAKSGC